MQYSQRQIVVEAEVQDKSGKRLTGLFCLDTGAQASQLSKEKVQELNFEVVRTSTNTTAGGVRAYKRVLVPSIRLGQTEVRDLHAFYIDTSDNEQIQCPGRYGAIGTLGADFLIGKTLTIDYGNWRLALTQRPFQLSAYRKVSDDSIELAAGFAFLKCQLPGNKKDCRLLIDTGSSEGVIFGQGMKRFVNLKTITRSGSIATQVGPLIPVDLGTIDWMVIGKDLRQAPATVGLCESILNSPLKTKYGIGLLGNEFMEKYIVQIDYGSKTLKLFEKQ
jgi:hypothetical protein